MSIAPGEITTTDLSPNANIQGTQIADKTLQWRNFAGDVLQVIKKGSFNVSSSGATLNTSSVAHGLSFTPVVLGFLNNVTVTSVTTTGSLPLPTWGSANLDTLKAAALNGGVATPDVIFNTYVQILCDNTNVIGLLLNATGAAVAPLTITYYLLQETAN